MILTAGLVFILVVAIIRSRYRKFATNVYVIHFRNGRVRRAGLGGAFFLLPIIDEYVEIPTTAQKVDIDAEKVISKENQELIIRGFLVWRVIDPEKTFSSIEWDKISPTLKDIAESVIRTTCANMRLIDILRERQKIINAIISELDQITSDWGIKIETVEIREVDVVNKELLKNLQAEMFWEQWRVAGLKEQESRKEVGIKAMEREKIVGLKEKEKEMALAEKDIEIAKLKALREKEMKIIEAEAEREAKLRVAQGEAEAEYIKLVKKAQGLEELKKAISSELIAYEIAQRLPEVMANMKNLFQNAIFIGSTEKFGEAIAGLAATVLHAVQSWSRSFIPKESGGRVEIPLQDPTKNSKNVKKEEAPEEEKNQ